jgi:hypothetical protein
LSTASGGGWNELLRDRQELVCQPRARGLTAVRVMVHHVWLREAMGCGDSAASLPLYPDAGSRAIVPKLAYSHWQMQIVRAGASERIALAEAG